MKFYLFCILFLSLSVFAHDKVTVSKIVSVYDGDTIRVDINGWPDIIGSNIPIRVEGIDTPELRGDCENEKVVALKARDYVRVLLASAEKIEISNYQRDKYFRILANVTVDGIDLGEHLLKNGLAVKYDPKAENVWCLE